MDRELLKAAWVRAYRSFLQAIVAQIPGGFVVTPAMIQYFKITYVYVILAIIANAVILLIIFLIRVSKKTMRKVKRCSNGTA